ncbi:unnamed protein product [Adineta steineri]|uniref:Uncharacterized protein n=3 Tax=Adineta steineri TaxID=433720 RepID=A0A814UTQ6_9BILA|nr:unnamed protein product [Adineta steineri]
MLTAFSCWFNREVTISEVASSCGRVFQLDDVGIHFFDAVLEHIRHFDEFNRRQNETFLNDVDYITQCTIADLTLKEQSVRSSKRLDTYLYIYRRIEEYINLINIDYEPLQQFKQQLSKLLISIFEQTSGEQPNLLLEDKDLLLKMNILQHLSSITTIDDLNTLNEFFVLSKLSMQAAQMIDDNSLHWIDILSKQAFRKFPFDTSVLIYLMQRMHLSKPINQSPFKTFAQLNKQLNLPMMEFFEQFQSIFSNGIKNQWYEMKDIAELFIWLKSQDQLFSQYFSHYSSNVSTDELWEIFLYLYKTTEINNIIGKYLISTLNERISSVSVSDFQRYTKSAKISLVEIKSEARSNFISLFEKIFDSYIIKQMNDPLYSYQISQTDCKELLQIGLEMSSTNRLDRFSCLLLVRKIICETDNYYQKTNAEKLKILFENLKNFDKTLSQKYAAEKIIDDEWLNDFLIPNIQVWLKFDQRTYQYLCDNHQNNPWSIYIWSKIVHLSLLKMLNNNHIDILVKMNDWMKNIKHDIYNKTDIFTIILVDKLFELVLSKYSRSILLLPNIDTIMNFIISMRDNTSVKINISEINNFINNGKEIVYDLLRFKSKCSLYRDLLTTDSVIYCFIPLIDLNNTLRTIDRQQYKFPWTTADIDDIIDLQKPKDIDIINIKSNEEFVTRFIQDINEWFNWFDRFVDIFQHIIDWFKNHNVNHANQILSDLLRIRNDPKMTLNEIRIIIDCVLKLLQPFKDLRRLCQLFNCLISFQILNPGTLNSQDTRLKFLTELKRSQPNNTFTIGAHKSYKHNISISDRQQVQWSLTCDNSPCDITIEYRSNNHKHEIIYKQKNVPIHKNVLCGQFETQRNGQMIITIDNKNNPVSEIIWYGIKSIGLSTCHLFHGIFNMNYRQTSEIISENEFNKLLDQTFDFIDKLLNGDLTLRTMTKLRTIFYDKNININKEVKKLYINHPNNDKQIEQVCQWLQIYQYYTHLNVIIECIEKFDILDNEDAIIYHLKRLNADENCLLREITEIYKILQECFQNLTHQHLQLIKTVVECSNVIEMMKKSDLYSNHGQHRFQQLRDNLTTQFQLQELNNMILNSWIITYTLIEPFILKTKSFDEFLLRLTQIPNLEESSLNHIKVINHNIQTVTMWLSTEETTVLDNALITMEHLYKNGVVNIYLQRLTRKSSYYEVVYLIDRIQIEQITENDRIQFQLSMSDIDDHKRQLTFCNVDVQTNLIYKKTLINGQLKLFQIIENIYHILTKLELGGHPDYQLRDEHYEIHLEQSENAIQHRIQNLESIYTTLRIAYDIWIQNLQKYRQEYPLLKLYSNREIMILIILLRTSNSIRNHFLKELFQYKDLYHQNEEEQKLAIHCLEHYLRSLRIPQVNLTKDNLIQIYLTHRIDTELNTDMSLKRLKEFLHDLYQHDGEIFQKEGQVCNENQQFLVDINHSTLSFSNDFDLNTCCILLNIFQNQLPASYQILWCLNTTEDDIHLFFSRIRTFPSLIFVIMDIDKMHHHLRELLLNEQDLLTRQKNIHAQVFYFSHELTTARKGLREFQIPDRYKDSNQSYYHLMNLFQENHILPSQIQIIYGKAGIGKTHLVKKKYKTAHTSCFSLNDKLNLSLLINSFLLFDADMFKNNQSIIFNISIHAPFESLNRTLFSLFICGCLNDPTSGLIFSLPDTQPWKFIIEVPYSDVYGLDVKENFKEILPILSIICPSTLEEVTDDNYQLCIEKEEEVVARFLKAFEDKTIDRMVIPDKHGRCTPISFKKLTNDDDCRKYIYNCIRKFAPELPKNKVYELSFTKFLYRRVRFFEGYFYCWNEHLEHLGSIAMQQMINEAKSLTQINFQDNNYPRIYLTYDPGFSLRLLYTNWNDISPELQSLFSTRDPLTCDEYKNKNYFAECLSWLIDINYNTFMKVVYETKFILTENFTYKIFHVHERKLTKLPLIIEGDTGVGKTFLLKFYSLLLNSKTTNISFQENLNRKIIENSSKFLLDIIETIIEKSANILNIFLQQIKPIISDQGNYNNNEFSDQQQNNEVNSDISLEEIKLSLKNNQLKKNILYHLWKTILNSSNENPTFSIGNLIEKLNNHVTNELIRYPLIEGSFRLKNLLKEMHKPTIHMSIEIFKEYLFHNQTKPLFYRLLIHPGITEEQIVEFISPICHLAQEVSEMELVVFFDEVNTASCLGLFKEMFMDGTLHGKNIPKNIFFTAAINPLIKIEENTNQVHRSDYVVHDLPQSLKDLKVSYGSLQSNTLADYIRRKIAMFQITSTTKSDQINTFDLCLQDTCAESLIKAHEFCEKNLGHNSVSQREIQRCFNLIDFFLNMRYDEELKHNPNPIRSIALSIALIYYFRLPTKEDNHQRNDKKTPSREQLAEILCETIPDFDQVIDFELKKFVNTNNFVIPQGVAINQAVREHIFSIVVSIVTRTPLCIIGVPGQSKTLSFQIVLQNLQGSQLSLKPFCKRLPSIDPFFCLGSKYTSSEDLAFVFDRAIKREQQYEQNGINTRCTVFLDEASLPDEKKMILKVLHPYLDECKVAFVAVANKAFDAANANRMICIYRSLPSEDDQKILAYGCLGLQLEERELIHNNRLNKIIYGLCQGYRRILRSPDIPHIFHDRDFIYMLRELRFELMNLNEITPQSLLRALEDNFNGIRLEEFDKLVEIFGTAVAEQCPDFQLFITEKENFQRNIPTILRHSMQLDPIHRRLYGRYKLIIDESEDENAVRLLFQLGILDSDPNQITIFRMSDFPSDIDNELRNVEILSNIKLCMETGKTILMVNTGRIHGSLYDVFNQNFSIMATDESRKIFSKVAIGPKTIDVVVHEDFQCIVHIKRSEFKDIPPPFLSRFQKYYFNIADFYSIQLKEIPIEDRNLMKEIEIKARSFIDHFGREYFYGFNDDTLYSYLLSFIKRNIQGEYYLSNIQENYNQLTIQSKSFIEQNINDKRQSLLFSIISKILQLVSPESIIFKLPTFEENISRLLCQNYFYQQEHFNFENFLYRFISSPTLANDNNDLLTIYDNNEQNINKINITKKLIMFTRTSSFVISLNRESKNDLFHKNDENYIMMNISEKIDIINLGLIENSSELNEQFENFEKDNQKSILIIVIDGRISHQRIHIPFIRQLIDKTSGNLSKFFIILIHSSGQELNYKSCFPSIFSYDWDYWFLDTSTPGSAVHLQKMLQIFTSKIGITDQKEILDNPLYDLNILFDDCLWDFCSRLQINFHKLSKDMFNNQNAYEFYQRQTTTYQRVRCLKNIFEQLNELQKYIITIYHENISMKEESLRKNCNSIYDLAKDTLTGKHFNSLADSLKSHIRISFTNFVSYILKYIVDDYGLESLSKLSSKDNDYSKLLELIDYTSFSITNENSMMQRILIVNDHYSCILHTPLYYLCQQSIKNLADDVKYKLANLQNQFNERGVLSASTIREQFRNELVRSIMNDKILTKIISSSILDSYTNDSIRILCTIIEKNFHDKQIQCQKTIDFVSRWLILIDDDDDEEENSFNSSSNRHIWRFANVYSLLEYEQNDILSFYSACRITENLDRNQSFYNELLSVEEISRSKVRENLFRLMFKQLWINLSDLCQINEDPKQWIHSYMLISKYHPSEQVLGRIEFIDMKVKIEFMNLSYLIFLNEQTPQPIKLIQQLLYDTSLIQDKHFMNFSGSNCLKYLPLIVERIDQYFKENNSTLMMDIQQWIIETIKKSKRSSDQEIICLLKFINQPSCHLLLPMKQFIFDELANILLENNQQNTDFWDRISLLSIIIECIDNDNLGNYQLPYHPSAITDGNANHIIVDLFFFYLRRLASNAIIQPALVNKILLSRLPKINDAQRIPIAEKIFNQLKEFFILQTIALLLCQTNLDQHDQQTINHILTTVINQYLGIEAPVIQLSNYVQFFCSIIITKQSWSFFLNLLKSEHLQYLNVQWADTLHNQFTLEYNTQRNRYLHYSHQLQFTITTDQTSSIFPTLHQPYHTLTQLIDQCIKNNSIEQRWIPLVNWIESTLNSNPLTINVIEIKVMILLIIYYDYYCNNQLESVQGLMVNIEHTLQLSDEERRVFNVFLQPEQYMIGYPEENNDQDKNYLNDLFKIDYQDEQQLPIRHTLVNLLAMILLSGKENTLWTFAFQPLKLENTYGFASTATNPIQSTLIHYDCGCVLSERGALLQKYGGNAFSIPAVYIAYFATFGALAWHLLLFDTSVENLNGPILSGSAINETAAREHIDDRSDRAKTCFFVCTRLLSTNFFLLLQSNQDDACLLFNRCFELFAQQSHQPDKNPWIQPIYTTINEEREAEKEFQQNIFYPTYQKLNDYKQIINILQSKTEVQTKLQNYITQMPIRIEIIHFKTELSNPESIKLPLKILRQLFDSFEFLKMTRLIYPLSQFHILLHRTFAQLIEREEFLNISLDELYKRACQSSNRLHQQNKYKTIIENGIEAVNTYHQFADGQIRPGACDLTQRFETISMKTHVSYLVETDNHEDGNIIMRILSILVDYHNNLVKLLETEIYSYGDTLELGPLKPIINELSEREISILQITEENHGVITLNDVDCQWIEQLSRSSLENDQDYFLKLNTPLKFNFLYVQSYLIRKYLLYCHINYEHIKEKYQCYIKRKISMTTNNFNGDENDLDMDYYSSIADEWNHLEHKTFDQLQNEFNFLQRIIGEVKDSLEDYSSMKLSEFVQNTNYDQKIKDFPLSQIKYIRQFYQKSIYNFQHAFINVSHLINVPLDKQLSDELDHILKSSFISSNNPTKKEEFQAKIRMITEFLNDLKEIEDSLARQWTDSLIETCGIFCIENPIVELLPTEIKCKNYIPLCLKLIKIRSQLQEQMIDIEEKSIDLWNAHFDIQVINQSNENSFQVFRYKDDSLSSFNTNQSSTIETTSADLIDWWEIIDIPSKSQVVDDRTSLFTLKITSISLSPSVLFENCRKQAEQWASKIPNSRLVVTLKDGKQAKYFCKPEKFYEKLKKIFEEKKYDYNTTAVIDSNQLYVDFMKLNDNNSLPIIVSEYYVVEKQFLIPILLEYENNQFKYFAKATATLTSILNRFILDQQWKFTSPQNYFNVFDSLGRYISEDSLINKIYRYNEQSPVHLQILQCNEDEKNICEVSLTTSQYFSQATTWKQIDTWSKTLHINAESTTDRYNFWNIEQQYIIHENETLSFTLGEAESINVDAINEENIIDIILSYDKINKTIRLLKSCIVHSLLNNSKYFKQLDLKLSPEDCTLIFVSNELERQILEKKDMKNPISYYASMTDSLVHFEISLLIQIVQYDNQKEISIPISHRNITLKQLLEMIEINDSHTYLASYETKMILSELSTINETKFFLVKEHQTCLTTIEENMTKNQRYIINASINDIYKQNKNIDQDQYLIYEDDFIPSRETLLSLFLRSVNSPIKFNLTYEKLQANVTVTNDEEKSSIAFQCAPSTTVGRVHQIVCQLWKLNAQFYHLSLSDDTNIDEECLLDDICEYLNDLQLKLISIADVKCAITYQNEIVMIPVLNETILSSVMKDTLRKLLIPFDDIDRFEFILLDDLKNSINVDLGLIINDIRSDSSTQFDTISLLLKKNTEIED